MRVVVADDALLFRDGMVRVLQAHGFEVVAQADNAADLIRRVGGLRPDVVLVDIRMPPTHTDEGLRAAQAIRRDHPEIGVVVLSQYLESDYAMALLEGGGAGCGYCSRTASRISRSSPTRCDAWRTAARSSTRT